MTRTTLLAISLLCVIVAIPDRAAEKCDLEGRTIYAWIGFCGNSHHPEKNECIMMETKSRFVGDKILYYDDSTAASTGTVFYIGRRVDVTDDPLQAKNLEVPHSPIVSVKFTTQSAVTDSDVSLELETDVYGQRTGLHLVHGGWKMHVILPTCYSCRVVSYDQITVNADGRGNTSSHLTTQMCRID